MTSEPKHPEFVDRHVGQVIRTRRRQLGLSQTDLAQACAITFQQVQKYERGANRVSASMLYKIAGRLEVTTAYFFHGLDGLDGPAAAARPDQALRLFLQGHDMRLVGVALLALSQDQRKAVVAVILNILAVCAEHSGGVVTVADVRARDVDQLVAH